jgi:hypothetical protein
MARWKVRRKKPAPPAPDEVCRSPQGPPESPAGVAPPADDLVPGAGRPGQAQAPAAAPASGTTSPHSYQLHDGTVVEEGPGGRTFSISATPAPRGIGDPRWWRRGWSR